jgi:hypothetical protein
MLQWNWPPNTFSSANDASARPLKKDDVSAHVKYKGVTNFQSS